ncbi:MAG TPA: hypothetical protein VIL37_15495, partial [Natronosporangium sp.]
AVVDLGQIVRNVELDRGRPVNLVRVGMVIDALGRYLVDGGAMLYGVVERSLLSESALTSKERMVLGRWADDGLIEVIPTLSDRVFEIADITGLPVIVPDGPVDEALRSRFGWLTDAGRLLRLSPGAGIAVLAPMDAATPSADPTAPAIGRAKVPEPDSGAPADGTGDPGQPAAKDTPATAEAGERPAANADADESAAGDATDAAEAKDATEADESAEPTESTEANESVEANESAEVKETAEADESVAATEAAESKNAGESKDAGEPKEAARPAAASEPKDAGPLAIFASRSAVPVARTRISWHRFLPTEPNRAHATLLRRRWRCNEFECPVFGEHRRIGQPVPRLRSGVPTCPRHEAPVVDAGPREPAYPISIVVDDLPRRRLVVRSGQPLVVGRGADGPGAAVGGDPEVTSVAPWLHRAAAAWISPVHVRLEASEDGLIVTDVSDRGTVIWQRKGPDDHGTTRQLRGESCPLGEWDSVELYTGIELMRGDRRRAAVLGQDELASVLLDAPTAAHHQVSAR